MAMSDYSLFFFKTLEVYTFPLDNGYVKSSCTLVIYFLPYQTAIFRVQMGKSQEN